MNPPGLGASLFSSNVVQFPKGFGFLVGFAIECTTGNLPSSHTLALCLCSPRHTIPYLPPKLNAVSDVRFVLIPPAWVGRMLASYWRCGSYWFMLALVPLTVCPAHIRNHSLVCLTGLLIARSAGCLGILVCASLNRQATTWRFRSQFRP